MSKESSAAINIAQPSAPGRTIEPSELIRRMAEDLRARSGSDLPLSCYIEQVRMQLAGRTPSPAGMKTPSLAANSSSPDHASDLFKAWAMPE